MGLENAQRWVSETLADGRWPETGLFAAESREDGRVELIGADGCEYLVTVTVKP